MGAGLAIAAVVLLGLAILVVARRLNRQRARILERAARELGFSFSRYAQPFLTSNVQGLTRLLHQGPSSWAENVVQASVQGWPMYVIDLPTYSSLSESASTVTFAWERPGDGCHPNRETWVEVERAGFEKVTYRTSQLPR